MCAAGKRKRTPVEALTIREQRDTTIMSTTRRTAPLGLGANIIATVSATKLVRLVLGITYWSSSIYLRTKMRLPSMLLGILQIHSLSSETEDQTIMLNGNITTITIGNH